MNATVKAARVAGAIYLAEILLGPFSLIYVPSVLLVSGDATVTARNILAHETLFRLAIVGDLVAGTLSLFLVLALYRLFKDVDRSYAALMVILGGLMVTPIFFLNALNWLAALFLVRGADVLAPFSKLQQNALAMLFVHLHSEGNTINGIFWGLWLLPFGVLVVKSGFIPRLFGYWLIVGGIGYLAISLIGLLAPQYSDIAFTIAQPALLGEVAITLWLLIKGASAKGLRSSASSREG